MDVITLRFHHGGKLINNGDIVDYVGGTVSQLCKYDPDYITGPGIIDYVSTVLGSKNVKNVYYLIPGQSLAEGLRAVGYDKGVIDMCEYAKKNPVVEIYSDHDHEQIVSTDDDSEGFVEVLTDVNIEEQTDNEGVEEIEVDVLQTDNEKDIEYEGVGDTDSDISSNCDWLVESDEELLVARQNLRAAKEREKSEKKRNRRRKMDEDTEEENEEGNEGGNDKHVDVDEIGQGPDDEGGQRPVDEGGQRAQAENWDEIDLDSDELHTPETSENEDDEVIPTNIRKRKHLEFNPKTDIKNVEFSVGMKFTNHREFKEAVKQYAIGKKYNVWFSKNARDKIQVKCAEGCPWNLWASVLKHENTFTVKSYNNVHKCTNKQKNRQVNARFLAKHYYDKIKACPFWKLSEFQWDVKKHLKVRVSLSQCYRAREIALKRAYATIDDIYGQLWDYEKELMRANKGSTFEIKVDRQSPEEPRRF